MGNGSFYHKKIPEKIHTILTVLLLVFGIIAIRLWFLSSIEHDKKVAAAKKPQHRVVYDRVERGRIVDRFGIPLAKNTVQYRLSILYSKIAQLPRWSWKKEGRKRIKTFVRKEHITKLSILLGNILNRSAEEIEDLIHSKAAVMGGAPYILQENITEEQFFRLKMLEVSYPGILAEYQAKRVYPQGKVGCGVVGYLGSISQEEYDSLCSELKNLREIVLPYEELDSSQGFACPFSLEDTKKKIAFLEEKASRMTDPVGKAGIEAQFDTELRGKSGKSIYLTDRKGKKLREVEFMYPAVGAEDLQLTISFELQQFAEQLLIENEPRELMECLQPEANKQLSWIKGGAIVVMKPDGQILALASYPRFDPNDFIKTGDKNEDEKKEQKILKWLEHPLFFQRVWDGFYPLERETYPTLAEERIWLSWSEYLRFLMPEHSSVRENFIFFSHIKDALAVQKHFYQMIELFSGDIFVTPSQIIDTIYPENRIGHRKTIKQQEFLSTRLEEQQQKIDSIKKKLTPYFLRLAFNGDKLLFVDLCRLMIDASVSENLASQIEAHTLDQERQLQRAKVQVEETLKSILYLNFSEKIFSEWRKTHFTKFLEEKREQEKIEKRWATPYIDYLNQEKKRQFDAFWLQAKEPMLLYLLMGKKIASNQNYEWLDPWLDTIKSKQCDANWLNHYFILQQSLQEIQPTCWSSYLLTLRSFEELNHELYGYYSFLRKRIGPQLGKDLAAAFYPLNGFSFMRSYAYRQAMVPGSIFKLISGYEALKQKYLQLGGRGISYAKLNPLTIIDDKHRSAKAAGKWNVGFYLDGTSIPMHYKGGRLPRSEHSGIGKIDLLAALETSSNPYFALVAAFHLDDPEDLCNAARLFGYGSKTGIELPGEYAGHIPDDISYNRTGLYAMAIGQHSLTATPLQTATMLAVLANRGEQVTPTLLKNRPKVLQSQQIFMPKEISDTLILALKKVVVGEKGTARFLKNQFSHDWLENLVGKTSTAEDTQKVRMDSAKSVQKVQHIAFGSIYFDPNCPPLTTPKLICMVYLRHGKYGRLAAPLAAKVIQKWEEIEKRMEQEKRI